MTEALFDSADLQYGGVRSEWKDRSGDKNPSQWSFILAPVFNY